MADCRFPCGSGAGTPKETVCIDTQRILDSCRDRDCFENVRVLLTGFGNDIIEHTNSIRTRTAEIVWTAISVDAIPFNRGFYSVNIKFFIKLCFEACIGGGRSQEFEGMAVVEKHVVLFGGEHGAKVFKSRPDGGSFCSPDVCGNIPTSLPVAVVEVVEPVVLSTKILEECEKNCCCCCCCLADIPESVSAGLNGSLRDDGNRYLAITVGIFSVVRLVRPGQFIVSAAEYSVPDKECIEPTDSNPCSVFRRMPFPVGDFGVQTSHTPLNTDCKDRRCGS